MQITNLRRQSGGGGIVATFDIEVAPGFRLTNWQLRRTPGGIWRTFPPSPRNGVPAAITSVEVRDQITAAASTMFHGGQPAHDSNAA